MYAIFSCLLLYLIYELKIVDLSKIKKKRKNNNAEIISENFASPH